MTDERIHSWRVKDKWFSNGMLVRMLRCVHCQDYRFETLAEADRAVKHYGGIEVQPELWDTCGTGATLTPPMVGGTGWGANLPGGPDGGWEGL